MTLIAAASETPANGKPNGNEKVWVAFKSSKWPTCDATSDCFHSLVFIIRCKPTAKERKYVTPNHTLKNNNKECKLHSASFTLLSHSELFTLTQRDAFTLKPRPSPFVISQHKGHCTNNMHSDVNFTHFIVMWRLRLSRYRRGPTCHCRRWKWYLHSSGLGPHQCNAEHSSNSPYLDISAICILNVKTVLYMLLQQNVEAV